jgi:probable H4MPT-linked C1 transfer pathway protein
VASANWLATASLLAFYLDEGLLVDVGSTTTDIVPFASRRVLALGFTDYTRLRCGELVYAGVVRTPVMAMARQVPVGGAWVPLMAECFATAADVYRLLGLLPEYADKLPSADRGEKTSPASARRLARMVGSDLEGGGIGRWRAVAAFLAERQLRRLRSTCDRILSRTMLAPDAPLVGAGVGRFVVQALALRLGRPYVDFCEVLDTANWGKVNNAADCAGAISVAYLAQR